MTKKNSGSKKKSDLKKKAKKAGKKVKKVAKSDVGRAGIGGGLGALALGPVGAIAGAGIAMATKEKDKAKKNPSEEVQESLSPFMMKMPIDRLGVQARRPINALKAAGINTIEDLTWFTEDELLMVENFPRKALNEVKAALKRYGLRLAPSQNPSLSKTIKQRRARTAAKKASRAKRAASEVSKKSLKARLAKINPVSVARKGGKFHQVYTPSESDLRLLEKYDSFEHLEGKTPRQIEAFIHKLRVRDSKPAGPADKTLDQYAKNYIKKRAAYLSLVSSPGSTSGEIARAKKQFDDAGDQLTLYAEIRNMDPSDLERFMRHAAKKQEEARRRKNPSRRGSKLNPLRHIPKGASERRAREVISENIAREMDTGKSQEQAVAIALHQAREDAPVLMAAMYPRSNPHYGDAVERAKMKKARDKLKRQPPPAPKPPPARAGKPLAAKMEQQTVVAPNPKKKTTPEWQKLINRCQKLWETYCNKPTKKNLKVVLDHLEKMKASKSKKVKKERSTCLRVANKEAKRLKVK